MVAVFGGRGGVVTVSAMANSAGTGLAFRATSSANGLARKNLG